MGTWGKPVAVLLVWEEYHHYLDLLKHEADTQEKELASRHAQAAARKTDVEL